ncbi:MAG: hypothetical protein WDO69_32625 [Pseudomonadota bacterium]
MSSEDLEQRIWQALDERRGRGEITDLKTVAELLEELNCQAPPDLFAELVLRLAKVSAGELSVPRSVTDFVVGFATRRPIHRAVDPWCQLGQFAAQIGKAFPETRVVGITNRADVHRLLTRVDSPVEWRVGRADEQKELLGTDNDLVVSCPPFGARGEHGHGGTPNADELAAVLLLLGGQSLASNGEALFILTLNCWMNSNEGGWRSRLAGLGLAVGACISIPGGTFAPLTGIPTVLVQLLRGQQKDIFVGELPESDDQRRVLLGNFTKHQSARDARLGRWVSLDAFTSLGRFLAEEKLEQLGRRAGNPMRLGDISSVQTWNSRDDVSPSAVLLPLEGSASRPALLASSSDEPKGRHVALEIRDDVAVPEYVVRYFNSELGQLAREAAMAGSAVPRLSKGALLDAPVYLPELHTQRGAVGTSTKIQTLINELRELDEKLWSKPKGYADIQAMLAKVNHEDRFEVWLDTLPFPLATILWVYATERSAKGKVDTLLHFFEAYAEFWATALLSIFLRNETGRDEWNPRVQQVLRDQKQSLDFASFGTWLTIVELLAKAGRDLRSKGKDGEDALRRQAALADDRFLDVILSKEVLQTLRATNSLRNALKGHSGIINDEVAGSHLAALEAHLGNLRSSVGERWQLCVLCRIGQFEFRDGLYLAQAERVVGTRAPFAVDVVELTGPAESGRLHLLGPGARDALPLLPFVRVMASPKTALNACYFYNRRTKEGVRFVSYHYAEDSDVTDRFDDTARAVSALSHGDN